MQLEKLSEINSCILISGETGTGKTRMAKNIHLNSARKEKPFVRINVATLSPTLIESELYGHTKGAFTGAINEKKGLLEQVCGGTLFLDEIGELDILSQKKLLDLVETRRFKRVGGVKELSFQGTLIFATNRDLEKEVKKSHFREDLYYRIRIFEKKLESLKGNRKLLEIILEQTAIRAKKENKSLYYSEKAIGALLCYSWPGNFRELENTLEYLSVVCEGSTILAEHLPLWIKKGELKLEKDNYKNSFEKFEKCLITDKLIQHLGKINETAIFLEISKTTLIQKIRKYNIEVPRNLKYFKENLEMV